MSSQNETTNANSVRASTKKLPEASFRGVGAFQGLTKSFIWVQAIAVALANAARAPFVPSRSETKANKAGENVWRR